MCLLTFASFLRSIRVCPFEPAPAKYCKIKYQNTNQNTHGSECGPSPVRLIKQTALQECSKTKRKKSQAYEPRTGLTYHGLAPSCLMFLAHWKAGPADFGGPAQEQRPTSRSYGPSRPRQVTMLHSNSA